MYCRHCGFNIGENAQYCPACGKAQQYQVQGASNIGQLNQGETINTYFSNAETSREGGLVNILWGFLSLIPIVGFILYFSWREKYPKRAKICLYCAFIGMIINIILYPYVAEELSIKLLKL